MFVRVRHYEEPRVWIHTYHDIETLDQIIKEINCNEKNSSVLWNISLQKCSYVIARVMNSSCSFYKIYDDHYTG